MTKQRHRILMLGPSMDSKGGIASVINAYYQSGLFDECGIEFIPTYRDGNFFGKIGAFSSAFFKFIPRLFSNPIKLTHAHVAQRTSFYRKSCFLALALIARKPYIIHLHGSEFKIFYEKELDPFRRSFVAFILNHALRVIVLSRSWEEWVKTSFHRAKVEVVPNPVSDIGFVGQGRKDRQILFLGRLCQRKGIYDLLRATSVLKEKFPDLTLVLCGDGETESVRENSKALGLDDILQIRGWVYGNDKKKLLLESTMLVLPSYEEGLPMSLLEAMNCGLPVISAKVGGVPDLIRDRIDGLLIAPGDLRALEEGISLLLRDETTRLAFASAARKRVAGHYSMTAVSEKLRSIYAEKRP